MVKDYWNPIKLFRCLAVKGKNYTKLHNKTLGGRIAKKGTRPIPEGFLDRFLERYAEVDPALVPVKEAVREYYTKRLTDGDYDFDSERTIYPELFEEQLGAVQDTSLVPSKYIRDISHDRQWRVVRIVNKGAFGMVYLLEWYPFKNMNPIKFALKETCIDFFWGDYCSEGELTRRLNMIGCPNVVKVHDWVKSQEPKKIQRKGKWETQYRFRILYDYHEHGDLADLVDYYLENGLLLPEPFVWHIIHQVATALLYCTHGQPSKRKKSGWEEIVHRDVKPKNILLGPNPEFDEPYPKLLLADFGLGFTIPNEAVRTYKKAFPQGTPGYVAPEARNYYDSNNIGVTSDIYALGNALNRIVDESGTMIYTDEEIKIVRQQPDIDRYLPYTKLLMHTKEKCSRRSPKERPDIFSLWSLSGKRAKEWAATVRGNRIEAIKQGKEFYYGMVLYDKSVQPRVAEDRYLHEEFQRETNWALRNRDRVQEIRDELARQQGGLPPRKKTKGFRRGFGFFT